MPLVRLMTYAPGHFHAALVQKEMYPEVSSRVDVYAPLDTDLLTHLGRIASFNARANLPTCWELEVHTSSDPLRRMLQERPGNVVVLSGRNRGKIEAIVASLRAGLHVLADKPWVIRVEDLPRLAEALDLAEQQGLIALDIMTERWEVTTRLQRLLLHDVEVFGVLEPGSQEAPAVFMESEHFLCKKVAGIPLRRPAWFFDVDEVGEGLSDVGTHLVDLVPWLLFPGQGISCSEIEILRACRVPTTLSRANFESITGEPDFPPALQANVCSGQLLYYCNTTISYVLRGIHVWLNVAWGFEAGPGQGDRHLARIRGSRSSLEVRQGAAEYYRPEVYIVPHRADDLSRIESALDNRLQTAQKEFPGVGFERWGETLRLIIPEKLRVGHEAHFGEVTRQFLSYLRQPQDLPSWEKANMLAKYHLTTHGVQLARDSS